MRSPPRIPSVFSSDWLTYSRTYSVHCACTTETRAQVIAKQTLNNPQLAFNPSPLFVLPRHSTTSSFEADLGQALPPLIRNGSLADAKRPSATSTPAHSPVNQPPIRATRSPLTTHHPPPTAPARLSRCIIAFGSRLSSARRKEHLHSILFVNPS
jgi:hypothetical protein